MVSELYGLPYNSFIIPWTPRAIIVQASSWAIDQWFNLIVLILDTLTIRVRGSIWHSLRISWVPYIILTLTSSSLDWAKILSCSFKVLVGHPSNYYPRWALLHTGVRTITGEFNAIIWGRHQLVGQPVFIALIYSLTFINFSNIYLVYSYTRRYCK